MNGLHLVLSVSWLNRLCKYAFIYELKLFDNDCLLDGAYPVRVRLGGPCAPAADVWLVPPAVPSRWEADCDGRTRYPPLLCFQVRFSPFTEKTLALFQYTPVVSISCMTVHGSASLSARHVLHVCRSIAVSFTHLYISSAHCAKPLLSAKCMPPGPAVFSTFTWVSPPPSLSSLAHFSPSPL